MASVFSGGAGGGGGGVDEESRAAQRRQEARIEAKEARERRQKRGRETTVATRSGRGQGVTLFQRTGQRGVTSTLGGGGSA